METRLVSESSGTKRKLATAMGALDTSVKRLAFQPAIAVRSGNEGHLQETKRTSLSKAPRDLHRLWDEYEFRLDGRKAARRFTPEERGLVKFKYSRRKAFWDIVQKLINSGYSNRAAIDKIYSVYGENKPVTAILKLISLDRRRGEYPQLQ